MVNLLNNPTFETNVNGWGSTQATLSHGTDGGHQGSGYMLMTSTGTGNRNSQALPLVPCAPSDVFSAGLWAKWVTGTPKAISVMIQFLDDSSVQTGNIIGSLVTPGTSEWSQITSLAATAPAGTTQARFQVRMNSAANGDVVAFDAAQLNTGATLDEPDPEPTGQAFTYWDGTTEVEIVSFEVVTGSGTDPVTMTV